MNDQCGFDPARFTTAPHQTEGWLVFQDAPEEVFARLADHASMSDWVPLIQHVTVAHPRQLPPGESAVGTTRTIALTGGLEIVETVVHWNPPHCYAYTSVGKQFPFKNYVGLYQVEPADKDGGGRFTFREYFDEMGRVEQAILPHGAVGLFEQALGNLSRVVGGTEYAMTAVKRA